MTPTYCGEYSLNTLAWEEEGTIEVGYADTVTPALVCDAVPRDRFLGAWSVITMNPVKGMADENLDDDLRALRASHDSPGPSLDYGEFRKQLGL